ncbi:MAG: cysteine desulfurase family protein [Gammaproteobacteria bacterium]
MKVYLDHNATTPLAVEAREAMQPYLEQLSGNPSGIHRWGRLARAALERAREQVAGLINAHPSQIIFTSGATEANNLALKGWAAATGSGSRLAVSAVEHASVMAPARALARRGLSLSLIEVDREGRVTPATLSEVLSAAGPGLVSVMSANNETGVIQDLAMIADRVRGAGGVLHSDAAQAAGKIELDFTASGVHLMSLSAHKLYGPQGAGALVLDKGVELEPLLHGGGQEGGLRAGTENLAAIVGFGAAAEIARRKLALRRERLAALRAYLEGRLRELPQVVLFAELAPRLPNTVCLGVPGLDGETLVMNLDRQGLALSSGSSCASASSEPSHVLLAMGVAPELARCAIRISLGEGNTRTDIDALIAALVRQIGVLSVPSQADWAPL